MVDHFFKGFIRGIQVAVCAIQVQLQLQWLQYKMCVQAMIKKTRMFKRRRAQTYRSNFEIAHKLGLHVKAALNTSDLQIQFYPITELYMIKDKEPCGRQLGMKSILEDV